MAESRDITAEHARTAARIASDVSVEHIADVYARAFLDAAEKRTSNTGFTGRVRLADDRRARSIPKVRGGDIFDDDFARGDSNGLGPRVWRPGIAAFAELSQGGVAARPARLSSRYPPPHACLVRHTSKPRESAIDHRNAAKHRTGQPHSDSTCGPSSKATRSWNWRPIPS